MGGVAAVRMDDTTTSQMEADMVVGHGGGAKAGIEINSDIQGDKFGHV